MNGSGPLDFEATINTSQFNRELENVERKIQGVGSTVVDEGNKMDETFKKAAAAMAAYFSFNFAKQAAIEIGKVRGEFQQLELAFETMLKNKQLSDQLMADIVDFAAKTPFDLKGVADGAKQLLAYGTQAKDIIPTMRRLGDIAAGLSIPFGDLVYLYGTSAVQGRIMTKDLMQFAGRGIPVIEELSKILNVAKSDILNLAAEGALNFDLLQQAVVNMTESTGLFGGLMEKQSKTITGLVSNLGDAWDQMLNNIGKANEGAFESSIEAATVLVENYQQVLDILKVIIATYGAYRAAIILNTVALKGYNAALTIATIRQTALNIAQKASPIGLALTGITALVGAVWAYNRATNASKMEVLQNNAAALKQVGATEKLIAKLKEGNQSEQERKKILEELKDLNPDVTVEINNEADAIQNVIDKYEEYNRIKRSQTSIDAYKVDINFDDTKAEFEEADKKINQFKTNFEVIWVNLLANFKKQVENDAESVPILVRKMFAEIEKEGLESSEAIPKILKKLDDIFYERITFGDKSFDKTAFTQYFRETQKLINSYDYLQATREVNVATAEYQGTVSKLETFIDNLVASYTNLNEEQRTNLALQLKLQNVPDFKAPQPAPAEAAKPITVLEKIKSLQEEIAKHEKSLKLLTSPSEIYNATEIAAAEEALKGLRSQLEQLVGKKVEPETVKEQLDKIQKQYENYYRWIDKYGKESADNQFDDLKQGGESFLEYLEAKIKEVESKGVKTKQQRDDLALYQSTKDQLIGEKSGLEQFTEQITSAKDEYENLADYIQFLKSKLSSVGLFGNSETDIAKISFLYNQLKESEKEYRDESLQTYKQAIEKAADFNQQRKLANDEYEQQINKLDKQSLGEEKYKAALEALAKIRDEALQSINDEEIMSSVAFRKLSTQMDELGRNEAKQLLAVLEEQLKTIDSQTDAYAELKRVIDGTKDALKQGTVKDLQDASNALRDMADFASLFDENIANAINGVSQLATGLASIASGNIIGGFLQIATGIFSTIINARKNAARKAEETQQRILDDLRERLSDINILLEKQISLIDKLSGSDRMRAYSDSFRTLRDEIIGTLNQINKLEVTRKEYPRGEWLVREKVNLDELIKTYSELFGNVLPGTGLPDIELIERLIDENKQAIEELYGKLLRGDIDGNNEEKYKAAAEELRLLIEQLESNTEQYEELRNRYNEYITGTTADSIIDSIARGFEEGKTSAEDFADTFEKLMKNAMLQALKMQALEIPLKQFYEQFANFSEDGLTSDEINNLREAYDSIIGNAQSQWEQLQEILDISDALPDDANSLSGAIKGVTEETAGLIAGQMNAIRINQAHALALMDEQLANLSEIASNTRYNRLLVDIKNLLQSSKSNSVNENRANGGL